VFTQEQQILDSRLSVVARETGLWLTTEGSFLWQLDR